MLLPFLRLALALAALAAASCTPQGATSPPSGAVGPQVAAASRAVEDRHERLLRASGGAYPDVRVQAYVERIGTSLVQRNAIVGGQWRFTILNTPRINAFALAPRDVYVTRGLLAVLEEEGQLAAVMGHEIGHIAARHTERDIEMRRRLSSGIGRALEAFDVEQALRLREEAANTLSRYSREFEIEADERGMVFLRGAGYAPAAAWTAMERLLDNDRLQARLMWRPETEADRVGPRSTHPSTQERMTRLQRLVRESGVSPEAGRAGRDEHLAVIDGLVAEDDASEGFVRGSRFVHPVMRFAFDAPDGFRIVNRSDAVRSFGRDGSFLGFDCAPAQVEGAGLVRELERQGQAYNLADVQPARINGFDGAAGVGRVRHRDGRMFDVRMTALRFGSLVCVFFGYAPPNADAGRLESLSRAARSFRALSEAEAARLSPWRIRVVQVGPADTVDSLAARMAYPDFKVERFRALNALQPDDSLTAGRKVKLVVE